MSMNGVGRLNPESIQDFGDVRTWARDHEVRMNSKLDRLHDEIMELRDTDDEQQKGISRNSKLLFIATIGFGSVLAVVVALSGTVQIIKVLF